MRKIKYPLTVSDYDGTLLPSQGGILEETKESIAEYRRSGGIFVLSSGRMTPSILAQARALDLTGLVVAYNGAEIVDIETGQRVFQGCLPPKDAVKICQTMEKMGLHFHVYDGDDFYSNAGGELLALYEKVCQVKGIVVEDKPLSRFIQDSGISVVKVVAIMSYEERDGVYDCLEKQFGRDYAVVRSAKYLVEVCDRRFTKGTALEYVASHYGIDLRATIAVGDNQNDLPMLECAGLGFAVANGEEVLQDKIAFLPYTNDENAVGKMIEKYAYTEDDNG